jgi:L-ribulose-5-phosphate 3-epimerase
MIKDIEMNLSLFTESLFALSLDEAIVATARIGLPALELACKEPHFSLATARHNPEGVARRVSEAGLAVSALSLYNRLTEPDELDAQVEAAATFIRLAPLFQTKVVKMTPGPPGSADATNANWHCLATALERLIPVAAEVGVRLAFETHMRQLTDTLAGAKRLLEMTPADVVGLTVDFSNLAFAGERLPEAICTLKDRMVNTHVKNGYIDAQGGWRFQALDDGLTDYGVVLRMLRDIRYEGYLTIECLGPDAARCPEQTARRNLEILRRLLAEAGQDQ